MSYNKLITMYFSRDYVRFCCNHKPFQPNPATITAIFFQVLYGTTVDISSI